MMRFGRGHPILAVGIITVTDFIKILTGWLVWIEQMMRFMGNHPLKRRVSILQKGRTWLILARLNIMGSENDGRQAPHSGLSLPASLPARISIFALGMSLGVFFATVYSFCVTFDLWFPQYAMNSFWQPLLPGFQWLTWSSFLLGLAEVFAFGWVIALIFGPLFNFFRAKFS